MSVEADTIVDLQEVLIVGNKRTKTSYFANEFRDSISPSHQANGNGRTAGEYIQSLNQFTSKLVSANLFDYVDSVLQVESVADGRCKASVVVNVAEKGVPYLNAQSYVRAGNKSDVGFEVQAALRSPFGHGEQIRLSSVTSAVGSREFQASATIPHVYGSWDVAVKAGRDQQLSWLSYQQALHTMTVQYRPSRASKHQFIAEYSLRDEIPNTSTAAPLGMSLPGSEYVAALVTPAPLASAAVLNSATSSIKSSLKHVWTAVDEQSKQLQLSLELAAGPRQATAEFLKADLSGRYERQIGPSLHAQPGLTLSLAGSVGMMYPLGLLLPALSSQRYSSSRPFTSYLSDRYHMGGPMSLRGFAPGGVGPRAVDRQDSLGGDAKSSLVAMLSVPLPLPALAAASMRAFAFVNAGSLGNSDYWRISMQEGELKSKMQPLFGFMRASAGAGISLDLGGAARVEATYSLPVLKAKHDVTTGGGFQMGVGLSIN